MQRPPACPFHRDNGFIPYTIKTDFSTNLDWIKMLFMLFLRLDVLPYKAICGIV